jgi:hypothetical protein
LVTLSISLKMRQEPAKKADAIADRLHDVLLAEIAKMAPTGGSRTVPISALADALVMLLAGFLVAAQSPVLPAAEIETETARLTDLFRQRLDEAVADRGRVGHA